MLEIPVIDITEVEAFVYAKSGTTVSNHFGIGRFPTDMMIHFHWIGKIATEIIALKTANGYPWKIKSITNGVQDS